MIYYRYCLKKYAYSILFYLGVLILVLLLKEAVNYQFFISIYREQKEALHIIGNNLIVFMPFLLPLLYFFSTVSWITFYQTSHIAKRITLTGRHHYFIHRVIIILTILFTGFALVLNYTIVPGKIRRNNEILRTIRQKSPYVTLEPFIFNRLGSDYIVHFKEFDRINRILKDIIVYKFKKGRLKNIAHVKKGYLDDHNNLVLTNGAIYTMSKKGKVTGQTHLDEQYNTHEIIEQKYFDTAFPDLADIPECKPLSTLRHDSKTKKGMGAYLARYEIHRRLSLSLSCLFFLLLIISRHYSATTPNKWITYITIAGITGLFIYKEIFLKLFLKYQVTTIAISIWAIDLAALALCILIFTLEKALLTATRESL